jgi:hypothetical protein
VRLARTYLVATAAATSMLLGACSEDDASEPRESPSASSPAPSEPDDNEPSTAPSETADPDEEAVLTAYQGYWDEYARAVSEEAIDDYVRAINNDTVGEMPIADVTALRTQQDVLQHVLTLDAQGRVMSGEPERLDPKVAEMDLEANIPAAQVTDCLDVEDWIMLDRESGEQIAFPEERSVRYALTAELERWEGTWRVTSATPDENSTC